MAATAVQRCRKWRRDIEKVGTWAAAEERREVGCFMKKGLNFRTSQRLTGNGPMETTKGQERQILSGEQSGSCSS
jgi:hypothetical protein